MIQVQLRETAYTLGDSVSGAATWDTDKAPDRVLVRVGWMTEGRGDVDSEFFDEQEMALGDSLFGGSQRFDFELRLPESGPPSYDGKILRIIWVVEARLDIPWAKDAKATAPFRVDL